MKTYKLLFILVVMLSYSSSLFSQWTIQHSGLPDSQNPTLIFSAVDSNICWGIQYEISNPKGVLTIDGGENWNLIQLPAISGLIGNSIDAINKDIAWITLEDPAGSAKGGIFKTTNGGADWIKQETAFPGSGGRPKSIYFFDADNGLCTGNPKNGYWEIYTTVDGGTNWTRVPSANIPSPVSGDETGGGVKKGAGNSFWFNSAYRSLYHSTDRGLTWTVARDIPSPGGIGLEIAFKDSLNGLVSSYFGEQVNKISSSSDGGAHWTSLNAPPHPSTYFIDYAPGTIGTYFITSHNNIGYPVPTIAGSAYSIDGGHNWKQIDSLPHGAASFTLGNTGWSAGRGDIIYKWKGNPLGITDESLNKQLNKTAILSQNYPNPFSSSTSIQFQIPFTSKVILKVYDLVGSDVATLVNETKPSGTYNVNFEIKDLSSGCYFYRLQVGSFIQTKKLFVL